MQVCTASTGGPDNPYLLPALDAIAIHRPGPGRARKRRTCCWLTRGYAHDSTRALLRRRGIRHAIPERRDQAARDRPGGLIDEYAQVASGDIVFGTHRHLRSVPTEHVRPCKPTTANRSRHLPPQPGHPPLTSPRRGSSAGLSAAGSIRARRT